MKFIQKHKRKLFVLALWLFVLAGYWLYASQNDLLPLAAAQRLTDFLQQSIYGPVIFLIIFLVRPLILFPAAILVVLAGFLFGPIWGVVYALSGNLLSAGVGYLVGWYFGQEVLPNGRTQNRLERYADYLRRNSFEGVLLMRLLLFHFDSVSYFSGFLKINWRNFLLATGLGSVAGIVSYVLAGASIEGQFDGTMPAIDPWMLAAGVLLFGVSFALAWYLRRVRGIVR